MANTNMNIRVTKLYQGAPWGALEVAFNSAPEGDLMIAEIRKVTGLDFKRPPANALALRELHIAEGGGEEALEAAFVLAVGVASRYGEVQDSQKNMKGPGELTPNELGKALKHHPMG
jgi:hypothetical protein